MSQHGQQKSLQYRFAHRGREKAFDRRYGGGESGLRQPRLNSLVNVVGNATGIFIRTGYLPQTTMWPLGRLSPHLTPVGVSPANSGRYQVSGS